MKLISKRPFDPDFSFTPDGFICIKQTMPKAGEFFVHPADVEILVDGLNKCTVSQSSARKPAKS
jgi:hypothetical protein